MTGDIASTADNDSGDDEAAPAQSSGLDWLRPTKIYEWPTI